MDKRTSYRFPFAQYPAVRLALSLSAGILLSLYWSPNLYTALLILTALLLICLSMMTFVRKYYKTGWAPYELAGFLLLVIALGWLRAVASLAEPDVVWEQKFLTPFEDEPVSWYGRVDEATVNANGTLSIFLRVDSLRADQQLPAIEHRFQTQIRFFRADSSAIKMARPGSYITLTAEPTVIPERRNPNDFNVRRWLNGMNIHITGIGNSIDEVISGPSPVGWGWWRNHFRDGIDAVFSSRQAPLAKAVMIGYKSELEYDVRQGFSRAGLAHLMAVSGMHVGFVLFPLWLIIPLFWGSERGKIGGLVLIVTVLFFYAGITGFAPSVQRASVFAFFVAFARLYQRRRDPINLTGLAAVIILLADPESLFAVGFQMSFIAVITIFVMFPVIRRLFRPEIRYRWHIQAVQLFLISVSIQLALFPILVQLFNEFSLIGPVMNSIAAPLTQVLFIWGFFCVGVGLVSPAVGAFLNIPADYMVALLEWITVSSAALPGAFITAQLPSVWLYGIWLGLFGTISVIFYPALRWRWLILLLLFTGIFQAERLIGNLNPTGVQVTFFDVGQGDAVLIQTPSGKNILYDAGVITPFGNSGERVLIPHFRAEGIRHLDAVILSHPHADHIGGMLALMDEISIGKIYDAGFEYHSAIFSGYRVAARDREIPVIVPEMGDRIMLDEQMPILVLGPHPDLASSNPNEHSIAVKILYGEDSLLLTGDAETQAERLLASQFGDFLETDILKAGHHGSRTSSHSFFLEYVNPEVAVVSNALRNRYNHPHPEAAYRLRNMADELHYTALDGAVIFEMSGSGIRLINWRD